MFSSVITRLNFITDTFRKIKRQYFRNFPSSKYLILGQKSCLVEGTLFSGSKGRGFESRSTLKLSSMSTDFDLDLRVDIENQALGQQILTFGPLCWHGRPRLAKFTFKREIRSTLKCRFIRLTISCFSLLTFDTAAPSRARGRGKVRLGYVSLVYIWERNKVDTKM